MILTRNQKISTLTSIIVVGLGTIAMFYYFRGFYLHRGYADTFLPGLGFGDFYGLTANWYDNKFAGAGYGHFYYPAAYLLVEFFSRLEHAPLPHPWMLSIFLFQLGITGFIFWFSWRNLKSEWLPETLMRAFVCTFMTYPVMFEMATGNFEGPLFVSLALFFILYRSGHINWSLPFLGLGIAMTLMPAVFCVLLLADKKYRSLIYVFLWVALFTLLPLLVFHGGLRDGFSTFFPDLEASQAMYFKLIAVQYAGNHFGHSLLNGTRVLIGQTAPLSVPILTGYMVFSLICFGGIAFYIVKIEAVFWKRVALLVCALDLLPYTSTDYKLLHFYVPMYLFISWNESDGHDLLYVILFGLLMIPKSYITLYHLDLYTTNVVLNTGAMVALAATIIITGLRARTSPENVSFETRANSGTR